MAQNKNSNRGLASADEETKKRVASEGGKASHGGGRSKEDNGGGRGRGSSGGGSQGRR